MEKLTMYNSDKITQETIQNTVTLPDQTGRERVVIKEQQAIDIATAHNVSIHDIYLIALKKNIIPYRYIRNLGSFTINDQLRLMESKVSIIGAGGLGGEVIILLARLGIGNLVVIDYDVFDETNLNRQALCSIDAIGKSKAETAKEIVARINPAVKVTTFHSRLDNSNAETVLTGSDAIVDALDNVSDRFILEEYAKKFNIPLVHGAVAGFEGQIMTIFPNDTGMENIYGRMKRSARPEKSPVSILGVPAVTPAIIASYQVIEVIKIILKKEGLLRNTLAYMDLSKGETRKLKFKEEERE